ncbi:hypothetical protein C1H46_013389 [Malus baccata]|uniref:Uncharacterized protein n=1 Tax=Malus baccata TaxID=106549 RepID=A0A540MPY5_MALBA|nr:hypothetical protein C1H46_013389 [Malus baccata]
MEGLIPFVYRAILRYKAGGQLTMEGSWYSKLPVVPYITIPADSASSDRAEIQLRLSECLLSSTSAMSPPPSFRPIASSGIQFPVCASSSSTILS